MRRAPVAAALVASFALAGAAGAQTSSSESSTPSPPVETPTGRLGGWLSDEGIFNESGAAFFERYPVISGVEPGSPASKAGVHPGDEILTFNSHDMRGGTLHLSNWMKPGAAFELRVRRNDGVRILRGVLGRRPQGWEQQILVQVSPNEEPFLRTRTEERVTRSGLQQSGMRVQMESPTPPRLPSLL